MKKIRAQVKNIITASFSLFVALCAAVFACYAWFTNNKTVDSDGINASVNESYITNFTYTTYALTSKTESGGTTTYTVGDAYESGENGFAIASYGSSAIDSTLLVISYKVNGGKDTMLTFTGSKNISVSIYGDTDESGQPYDYVQTQLSNAISMRLATAETTTTTTTDGEGVETTVTTIDSVSTSNAERCLMDPTAGNVKQEVIFNDVEADQTDYSVTLYILLEYDDENVTALYDMNSNANLSMPVGFTEDLNLTIEPAGDHTHTYGKWTVEEYTTDDTYAYTATRTCTQCGNEETVYISESDYTVNATTNVATAKVTVGDTTYTITFSMGAAGSGSSTDGDAITESTTIDLTAYSGDTLEGSTTEWEGITIDTTASGASLTAGSGYVQLTAGTVITFNVVSTATVSVTYYTGYSEGCTVTVENGVATITCTEDTCITAINVEVPVTVESVTISGSSSSISIGDTLSLTATVTLSGTSEAYSGGITWASSNTGVATVDSDGTVTAVGVGTATITATEDGGVYGRYTITVKCATHTEGEAVIENEVEVTCTTDGSYDTVVYCTVCGEELSRETTTITATGYHTYSESEWYYDSSTHWHECSVCGERIDEASHTYVDGTCTTCGASSTNTVTYIPDADKTLTASVDLDSGITVASSGSNGTDSTSGTYTGADGVTYGYRSQIKSASARAVTITIPDGLTNVSITIEGENTSSSSRYMVLASNTSVSASGDTGCLAISDGSKSTFEIGASNLSSGTYYIYSADGETVYLYAIKITYTVDETTSTTPTVSSVSVSGSSTSVDVGSTTYLWTTVTMSDSSSYSGTITWTSSDTSVATVDSSGTYVAVTAVGEGTAIITATADGVSGTYEIYVIDSSTHTHTYVATFTWATDYSWAYAEINCTSKDVNTQYAFATITSETTAATCGKDGSIVYTATVTYDDVTYTETQTVTTAATGEHTYTWSYDSSTHWQVCSVCGTTTEAEAHTFENGTCTVCGATETTATAETYSYDMSDYNSALTANYGETETEIIGTNGITIYFLDSGTISTDSSDAGILAYTTSGGSSTASSASSTYITTGGTTGGSTSSGRYFTIDLSDYEGYTVSISAVMSSTGSSERSLILSTDKTTSSTTDALASATSSSSSTTSELTYEAEVTSSNSTLYLTCSGSVRVYSITITLTPAT